MKTPRPHPSRWSRVLLLLAALLQFGGSAVGPVAHDLVERAAAQERASFPKKQPVPPHDERFCAVCQALGAAALPVEAVELALEPASSPPVAAGDERAPARTPFAGPARTRAPPRAS
jgi:hypothetical protein